MAQAAAHAAVFKHHARARALLGNNGILRAGRGAGHRVRALLAGILNHQRARAVDALGGVFKPALWPKHGIAADFDARKLGVGLAVVKFRAGKLAPLTAHAQGGVAHNHARRFFHNYQRRSLHGGQGLRGLQCGQPKCRTRRNLDETTARKVFEQQVFIGTFQFAQHISHTALLVMIDNGITAAQAARFHDICACCQT